MGTVDKSYYVYLVWSDVVDDSVSTFDYFADLLGIKLRNYSTREREFPDLLTSPCEPIDDRDSVFRRNASEIIVDCPQMIKRVVSPFDLHLSSPNF